MQKYIQEIEYLKHQIQEKENLLKSMHPKSHSQPSLYINYNKPQYDHYLATQQKQFTNTILNLQLQQHLQARTNIDQAKQQEIHQRLQALKKHQEQEQQKILEHQNRARAYKEDLDAQKYLKSKIVSEEKSDRKSPIPQPSEYTLRPSPSNPFINSSSMYHTKQHPKTLCFNPITGSLEDTSNYVLGRFPQPVVHKQVESLFLPKLKNCEKVPTHFASLKAFQQPKFTKTHPKVIQSFPVTGGQFFS